jgi:thiamine biosynthesis lipoprotein
MKIKPIILIIMIILVLGALILAPRFLTPRETTGEVWEESDFILGTIVRIKLYDPPAPGLFKELFAEIREYENLLSLNLPDSHISRINTAAGKEPVVVDPAVFEVIEEGLRYGRLSEGRFDITIGPLVSLWHIGYDDARVPSPEEIKAALPLVDLDRVEIEPEEMKVSLESEGMLMDLGAIAKGFIADRIADSLKSRGFERGIINLGGNVLTLGSKPGNLPYRIGIQNPWEPRGASVGVLELEDLSLVSSGDYERFFIEDGVKYHHILDTATGYPVENSLTAVTIVSERSVDGDGLSTSVFAMGLEKGYALIESLKGIEAIFITKDKKVYLTPGIEPIFTLSPGEFVLARLED